VGDRTRPALVKQPAERLDGVYRLSDLSLRLDDGRPVGECPLRLLVDAVVSWMADVGYSTSTVAVTAEGLDRFVQFAAAHGVTDLGGVSDGLCAGFFSAAGTGGGRPSVPTMHHRRSVLRVFFRVLHSVDPTVVDPTWALELPSRSVDARRPLSDDELDVLRAESLSTVAETRQPSIVALAEAGAVTTEIAAITANNVDLSARVVALPGCFQARARVVPLTGWGATQLRRRINQLDGEVRPLVYNGADRRHAGQASISTNLRRLFTRAGLTGECDLGLGSVRAWAGANAFRASGRIEDAANVMGCRNLDSAARLIGWHWQADP
jgi:site-specific recombinase XerD